MAGTRSSARLAASSSSPQSSPANRTSPSASRKRRGSTTHSPQSKRGKKDAMPQKQQTMEEAMPDAEGEESKTVHNQVEDDGSVKEPEPKEAKQEPNEKMHDSKKSNGTANNEETTYDAKDIDNAKPSGKDGTAEPNGKKDISSSQGVQADDTKTNITAESTTTKDIKSAETTGEKHDVESDQANEKANGSGASNEKENNPESSTDDKTAPSSSNEPVAKSGERKDVMPSNILEKGIVYFFVRGRVGVDDPQSAQDIARTYMVLRPIPLDAALGSGNLADSSACRLLALPKKVLPKSAKDRFMIFVERAGASVSELKADFLSGSDYDTQTAGARHSPAVASVGQGVYAITAPNQRESHLAYLLTVPDNMGPVQEALGLASRGSYVVSAKNPERRGPASAALPQKAAFPKELLEIFAGNAWGPLRPAMLDYSNAQFLLIGNGVGELDKAVEPTDKDKKDDNVETPMEEMEKLEAEDELRVEGLKGDEAEAIFSDLGLEKDKYPELMTTW